MRLSLFFVLILIRQLASAQSPGDYRSRLTGTWSTAATWQIFDGTNWVTATLAPNSSTGIITILSGHAVTSTANLTVDQLVINNGGTLNITGGTFTLNDTLGTDLDCSGTLGVSNNAFFSGGGTTILNSGSTFNWLGGYNAGTGTMNINAGAVCNIGTPFLADTKTFNNYGTCNWTSGNFYYVNGTPVINNYGTFNISTDGDLTLYNANSGIFNNMTTGIINKIGSGNEETYFNAIGRFSNAGTINVTSSKLRFNINTVQSGAINVAFGAVVSFSAGTSLFNQGTVIAGEGSLGFEGGVDSIYAADISIKNINVSNGTVSVTSPLTMNSGSIVNLSAGVITGPGLVTFNSGSIFNWSGGYNSGNGIMNINAGAAVNVSGGAQIADTKTINNYGTWTWTSGDFYYNDGSPIINNYGVFNINTDANIVQYNANTGSFNNRSTGVINKTGTAGDETFFNTFASFTNAGTINVISSKLRINLNSSVNTGTVNVAFGAIMSYSAGTSLFKAGTVFSGDGGLYFEGGIDSLYAGSFSTSNIAVTAGTVTINPSLTMNNGGVFTLSGGLLNGSGVITFNTGSTFNWTGGYNAGNGVININPGAVLNMSGGTLIADTKTINNYGTWNWISDNFYYNNGAPVANNYGTFNINSDADIVQYNANTGSFNNKATGVINKVGSPFTETSFNNFSSFNNAGAVNINSGNLTLNVAGTHAGTYKIAYGSQLRGSLAMSFTGPTFINDGGVTLTGLSFAGVAAQLLNGQGSINNLTINNASGIILGGSQTINTALTLTSGKITLGDNNLVLGTAATLTGGNATNYIVSGGQGMFQRRVANNNTNTLFPIGFVTAYMPVNIQLTAASVADNFAVRLLPNIYGGYDTTNGNAVGGSINANTVNSSWFITEGVPGGSIATITFSWNATNEAAGFNRALSRFAQYRAGAWSADAATVAATGTNPYTFSRSALTSFSVFGITNQFVTSMSIFDAFCSAGNVNIPYAATGTFNTGNVFTAQLSDSTGSYAAPVVIGSTTAISSGNIAAVIPANTLRGTGYRIRITSSAPALISPDNPSMISIRACSAQPPILTKNIPHVNVTNITNNEAVVSWNNVPSANKYEVQFKKAGSNEWNIVNVTNQNLPINLLQPNTFYEVKVRARAVSEVSDFSELQSFKTLSQEAVMNLTDGKLAIYPNPNNGRFTLMLHFNDVKTGMAVVQIVNAAGQLTTIERIPIAEYELKRTISFNSTNSNGIYFISVMAGNKIYYGKINYQK